MFAGQLVDFIDLAELAVADDAVVQDAVVQDLTPRLADDAVVQDAVVEDADLQLLAGLSSSWRASRAPPGGPLELLADLQLLDADMELLEDLIVDPVDQDAHVHGVH